MEKIVYRNGDGIAVITPSSDYQVKIVDRDIKAVVEPAKVVDGKLVPARVVTPAIYECHYEKRSALERAMKDIPKGAEYKIVETHEIGGLDRAFRNAWTYDMKIDIPKAKEIWKDKLRADRKPLLEAQDIAFMQALENGNDTVAIATEKQRLRDVPQLVDACKTITAIKKVTI